MACRIAFQLARNPKRRELYIKSAIALLPLAIPDIGRLYMCPGVHFW